MLKRSGFRQQSLTEIKEKQAIKREKDIEKAKHTPRKPQNALERAKKAKTRKVTKSPQKGYKPPKWFTSIKAGSHGNNPAQKKHWKVVSDTYRKADWEQYGGKCVSCPTRLERWEDGQLAHFKAWSVCNSWFKYERKNLALSCPNCNRLSDGMVGIKFAQELQKRHGKDILGWIETENLKHKGIKMEAWEHVDKVQKLRPDLVY
jgi:hypothetical protein